MAKTMKEVLSAIEDRYAAFSVREQRMVLLAVMVIAFCAWQLVLAMPLNKAKQLRAEIATLTIESASLTESMLNYEKTIENSQQNDVKAQLREAREQLLQRRTHLVDLMGTLSDPKGLMATVTGLLKANPKLIVTQLTVAPVVIEPSTISDSKEDSDASPPIYKHQITLNLQGQYSDLVDYLTLLNTLPLTFYYESVTIDKATYPLNTIQISFYTLTLDPLWKQLK